MPRVEQTSPEVPPPVPADPAGGAPPAPPDPAARFRRPWEQPQAELLTPTESRGPVLKQEDLPQAPPAESPSGKYVVLHGAVGHLWRQGEVVEAVKLKGLDVQRLVDLGAVRPADEREAAQERVTLPGTPAAAPLELQVLDRDRQLQAKGQEIVRLRDELRLAKQGPQPGAAPVPSGVDPKVVAEKDRAIEALQREVGELRQAQQQAEAEGRGKRGR